MPAGQEKEAGKASQTGEQFVVHAPQLSLPKGGGAIRSMGEKFAANPVNGGGSLTLQPRSSTISKPLHFARTIRTRGITCLRLAKSLRDEANAI